MKSLNMNAARHKPMSTNIASAQGSGVSHNSHWNDSAVRHHLTRFALLALPACWLSETLGNHVWAKRPDWYEAQSPDCLPRKEEC
jgi:hypothetical protein